MSNWNQVEDRRRPQADPPGKGKQRKQRSRLARYTRRTLFTLLGLIGFGAIAFAVAYILTPIPNAKSASTASGPTFYYAGGKSEIAHLGVNRQLVGIDQVPKPVQQAVVAAENRSFYTDPGVSVKGSARAVWSTLSGGQVQGGSTITQQMVRNYYSGLSQQRTVFRKLKEVMVSLKVGEEKPKDWILEQYLNTIYFGRNAYGIQAASQAYFGKDAKNLTPSEGAYLAAAIQQPTAFGTADKSDLAARQARWRYVLDGMVQLKAITPQEEATLTFPALAKNRSTNVLGGQKGYMVNVAINELKGMGYSEDEINRGGLKIETTFDPKLMDAAKTAVESNIPSSTSSKVLAGLVGVDSKTGEVQAFYGGKGYLDDTLSTAFGGHKAQAGSGFKPYVLAAALDNGYGLDTELDGSSPQYFGGKAIRNDGNDDYGDVNLVQATEYSINTAYVQLGQKVGLDKVTEMAEKLGIPESQLTANGANTAYTFPLGVADVSVEQQAGAYSAFANGGVFMKPHVVRSITNADGKKTRNEITGVRVFDQQVSDDATYAMRKVVENGTGTRAQLDDGRPVAGKTGTTTNGAALWFNGFVPQLTTSVGVYREDGKAVEIPGFSSYGGSLSAQIWKDYMTVATANLPVKEFGSPSMYVGSGNGNTYPTSPAQPTPSTSVPAPTPSASTEPNPGAGSQPSTGTSTAPADGSGDGGGPGGGTGTGTGTSTSSPPKSGNP